MVLLNQFISSTMVPLFYFGFAVVLILMVTFKAIEIYLDKKHHDLWISYVQSDSISNNSRRTDKQIFRAIKDGTIKQLGDKKLDAMVTALVWLHRVASVTFILTFICFLFVSVHNNI